MNDAAKTLLEQFTMSAMHALLSRGKHEHDSPTLGVCALEAAQSTLAALDAHGAQHGQIPHQIVPTHTEPEAKEGFFSRHKSVAHAADHGALAEPKAG